MPLEDQVLQGKGRFGMVLCGEEDLFGEMLQNQMLQGKDLSGEVLCEEEERLLWDSMEDFSNENPTPASTLTALSPLPTPRVGRKYKLPSRLPPGCFLLSTLDRDQVDIDLLTGQPWRK